MHWSTGTCPGGEVESILSSGFFTRNFKDASVETTGKHRRYPGSGFDTKVPATRLPAPMLLAKYSRGQITFPADSLGNNHLIYLCHSTGLNQVESMGVCLLRLAKCRCSHTSSSCHSSQASGKGEPRQQRHAPKYSPTRLLCSE